MMTSWALKIYLETIALIVWQQGHSDPDHEVARSCGRLLDGDAEPRPSWPCPVMAVGIAASGVAKDEDGSWER